MEYNQWLHDVLYKFSSLDNYRDSIHYRDSFTATIVIVKFLLSLSTKYKPYGHIVHLKINSMAYQWQ